MKQLGLTIGMMLLSITLLASACGKTTQGGNTDTQSTVTTQTDLVDNIKVPKVQVAILLDVSGSMDGLIEQAKSRLWNIVNTMTTLKYQGQEPRIEIALYAYGVGSFHNVSDKRFERDYLYQLTPFTTDLDLISEKLFALRTSGSEEYCGTVIHRATNDLEWGQDEADMKLIYIAGNETFEQGSISYKKSIPEAVKRSIYVNTIHCGSESGGIQGYWRDAAELGRGKFFNIDANKQVRYVETPYDVRIRKCNDKLNDTYIGYGIQREEKQMNQTAQDRNASSVSSAYMAERTVSKSKKAYDNSSWDLVDAAKNKDMDLEKLDKKELSAELQNKSNEEIKKLIDEKSKERDAIQKEIAELAKLRQEYIDTELAKEGGDTFDLGKVISKSIVELANTKGYVVSK